MAIVSDLISDGGQWWTKYNAQVIDGIEQVEDEQLSMLQTISRGVESPLFNSERNLNKLDARVSIPIAKQLNNTISSLNNNYTSIQDSIEGQIATVASSRPFAQHPTPQYEYNPTLPTQQSLPPNATLWHYKNEDSLAGLPGNWSIVYKPTDGSNPITQPNFPPYEGTGFYIFNSLPVPNPMSTTLLPNPVGMPKVGGDFSVNDFKAYSLGYCSWVWSSINNTWKLLLNNGGGASNPVIPTTVGEYEGQILITECGGDNTTIYEPDIHYDPPIVGNDVGGFQPSVEYPNPSVSCVPCPAPIVHVHVAPTPIVVNVDCKPHGPNEPPLDPPDEPTTSVDTGTQPTPVEEEETELEIEVEGDLPVEPEIPPTVVLPAVGVILECDEIDKVELNIKYCDIQTVENLVLAMESSFGLKKLNRELLTLDTIMNLAKKKSLPMTIFEGLENVS